MNFGAKLRRWVCHQALRRTLRPWLLARYCTGRGIEVGPGPRPLGAAGRTLFVDRFETTAAAAQRLDLRADAGALPLRDGSRDYVIASHCLEHCPDVLAVLGEWRRVLRPGGRLFLVSPHIDRCFDRGRTPATLEHHLADARDGVDPFDDFHWGEFERFSMQQYDHDWVEAARGADGRVDPAWVIAHGHLHYHAWRPADLVAVLEHVGLRAVWLQDELPERADSFLIVARRG